MNKKEAAVVQREDARLKVVEWRLNSSLLHYFIISCINYTTNVTNIQRTKQEWCKSVTYRVVAPELSVRFWPAAPSCPSSQLVTILRCHRRGPSSILGWGANRSSGGRNSGCNPEVAGPIPAERTILIVNEPIKKNSRDDIDEQRL